MCEKNTTVAIGRRRFHFHDDEGAGTVDQPTTLSEPSELGPVAVFAVGGMPPTLFETAPADVDVEPAAEATLLAEAGEIVAVLVLESADTELESVDELLLSELDETAPVIASAEISSGLLSMNAMVGPATMFPRNLSRGLLTNGWVLFVT